MDNFIGNNVKFLAEWGQSIMALIIIICLTLIYLMVRKNKYFLPRGILPFLGTLFLILMILAATMVFARITKVKPGVMVIINQLESIQGRQMPLTFLTVADSLQKNITEYKGKVVLLNFWATWCRPCLTEIPDLNQLQNDYKNKGLEVIIISDEKRDRLLRFHEKNNLTVTSGYVEHFDWANMGSERPVTFLLNQEGVIVHYFTGAYDYAHFESKVKEYLR